MRISHVREAAETDYIKKAYFDEVEATWTERAGLLVSMIADRIAKATGTLSVGPASQSPSVCGHAPSPRNFKLPELQLPKFGGDKPE